MIQERVRAKFLNDMKLVKQSKVNGLMKLWLYQFYVLARISWPLLIQDFPRSFAVGLEKAVRVQLKRWAGVFRGADVGVLFRSKSKFGLGLTSVSSHFERMQVIKCFLLKHSVDSDIATLYARRELKEAGFKTIWRASKVVSKVETEVHQRTLFPSQDGRQRLGTGNFIAQPSVAEKRKMVVGMLKTLDDEAHFAHAAQLCMQCASTRWNDFAQPFDL